MSDPKKEPTTPTKQPQNQPKEPTTSSRFGWLDEAIIPLLAILTAVLIGAVIVFFSAPPEKGTPLQVTFNAFKGLFVGAFGDWSNPSTIPKAISATLVESTPYLLAGLAVALAFKAGLFNIGAEGQLLMGGIAAAAVGVWLPQWFGVERLPTIIHLPLTLLAGALAGGLWGAIPGYLKAKTGAHEVINTIMLNYIALRILDFLIVNGPMKAHGATLQRTPFIQSSAALPKFIAVPQSPSLTEGQDYAPLIKTTNPNWDLSLHFGFVIALLAVAFIWWWLNRTPKGFEIKTVGANHEAARYAGMSITGTVVLSMAMSGALAGLAGTGQVLGLDRNLKSVFSGGLGFDSIAIALLAKSNPIAIIPAALFWGALRQGSGAMQINSGISINLVNIIQALVIMFIAADQIVRWIYRVKKSGSGGGLTFSGSLTKK